MSSLGFWLASLVTLIMDWRSGRLTRPRDPPFHPPVEVHEGGYEEGDDEESSYHHIPPVSHRATTYDDSNAQSSPFSDNSRFRDSDAPSNASPGGYGGGGIPAGRPSMDAYGAFSDPAPSGFAPPSPSGMPQPAVSRTMQYADPYAAIRSSINPSSEPAPSTPPSYETYQGYR